MHYDIDVYDNYIRFKCTPSVSYKYSLIDVPLDKCCSFETDHYYNYCDTVICYRVNPIPIIRTFAADHISLETQAFKIIYRGENKIIMHLSNNCQYGIRFLFKADGTYEAKVHN